MNQESDRPTVTDFGYTARWPFFTNPTFLLVLQPPLRDGNKPTSYTSHRVTNAWRRS